MLLSSFTFTFVGSLIFEVGNVDIEEPFNKVGIRFGVLALVVKIASVILDLCNAVSSPDSIKVPTPLVNPDTFVPTAPLGAISFVGGDGGSFLLDFPLLVVLSPEKIFLEGFRLPLVTPL